VSGVSAVVGVGVSGKGVGLGVGLGVSRGVGLVVAFTPLFPWILREPV